MTRIGKEDAMIQRVMVDRNLCAGHGLCLEVAPDHFDLDDEDLSYTKGNPAPDSVQEAIRLCPTQAIKVIAD
mgnify:FL=1